MKSIFAAAAAVLALSSPALAADNYVAVQAGRLLDRPGQAPRGQSTVLIRNGKVEAVRDGFVAPDGARVIDLRDRFVLPGLIDSHVHLDSDRAGIESQLAAVTDNPADQAYEAAMNAKKTLLAGFTTVRNLGDGSGAVLALTRRDRQGLGRGAAHRRRRGLDLDHHRAHGRPARLLRRALRPHPARQRLRRRGVLPPGGAQADRPRRRRHQDRHHRRREQPHRPGAGRPDVRRRGQGPDRDRPPLRQEGRGPRPRRRRHQHRAQIRRGLDRARHPDRRGVDQAVPEVGRLLRADPVDRERLPGADRRQPQRLFARGPRQDRLADQGHRRGAAARPIRAA